MFKVALDVEMSMLLDTNGVDLYVGEDQAPTYNSSIDSLVFEFLDSRMLGDNQYDVDDVRQLRDSFQRGLDTLNGALER